jgi:predicted RNase H-like HicB family nuclease
MLKYHLNIYWSEADKSFIAEVSELPGCMADGATYEEVIKNVQVIIQEWIEVAIEFDRPVPEPVYGHISEKGLLVEDSGNSSNKKSNQRQEQISIA